MNNYEYHLDPEVQISLFTRDSTLYEFGMKLIDYFVEDDDRVVNGHDQNVILHDVFEHTLFLSVLHDLGVEEPFRKHQSHTVAEFFTVHCLHQAYEQYGDRDFLKGRLNILRESYFKDVHSNVLDSYFDGSVLKHRDLMSNPIQVVDLIMKKVDSVVKYIVTKYDEDDQFGFKDYPPYLIINQFRNEGRYNELLGFIGELKLGELIDLGVFHENIIQIGDSSHYPRQNVA